jgi:hypothetical protein
MKPQSEESASGPRVETRTARIRREGPNHYKPDTDELASDPVQHL